MGLNKRGGSYLSFASRKGGLFEGGLKRDGGRLNREIMVILFILDNPISHN